MNEKEGKTPLLYSCELNLEMIAILLIQRMTREQLNINDNVIGELRSTETPR